MILPPHHPGPASAVQAVWHASTLSRHTGAANATDHFDWYLDLAATLSPRGQPPASPASPAHTLTTFRVHTPWHRWPTLLNRPGGHIALTLLPLHRRRYLRYTGPIRNNGHAHVVARTLLRLEEHGDSDDLRLHLRTPLLHGKPLAIRRRAPNRFDLTHA